jgi:tetratricopeptide (TPR) repeat protein
MMAKQAETSARKDAQGAAATPGVVPGSSSSAAGPLGKLGRLLPAGRVRTILLACGGVLLLGVVVAVSVVIATRKPAEKLVTLEETLAALDREEFAVARRLAEKLQAQGTLSTDEWGGPVFVLGVVADHEAEGAWEKDKMGGYLVAARYLEEARNRGFPTHRDAEGLYLLGKCLVLGGRSAAARPALQAALKVDSSRKTEIHRLLATSYLDDARPDLKQALAENALYLADKNLSGAASAEGLLQRAQILFHLDRIAECQAVLKQIPAIAAVRGLATVLRGQLLCREAEALRGKAGAKSKQDQAVRRKYEAAIEIFRLAQGRDTVQNAAARQAMYLTGLCMMEIGDSRGALGQLSRTAKLFAEQPEGVAASFHEADLSRQLKRDADALAAYRRLLGAISDPEHFYNRWVTLGELRAHVVAAYRAYLEARNFELALQLSRLLYPLLPQTQVTELTAEVHHSWGQSLLRQAEHAAPSKADWLRHLGRAQLRQAGSVYLRLAQLQVADRQYPDQLWNSANAFFEGQDYRNAVRVLEKYVENETRQRHSQALLALGEALLAMDQLDKALAAFEECVRDHPRDAAAYRARLLASHAHAEKGEFQQAESLLQANLSGEYLTPDSKEWRDSLFALGELLHGQGRHAEAIRRLEEAVARYADAPQATLARYWIADACRSSAQTLENGLAKDISSKIRAAHAAAAEDLFEKALGQYRHIQADLASREPAALTPLEKSLLRNSQFAVGEICFDLKEYGAAVKAYTAAADRYSDCPESLDAYLRLAEAYGRLGRAAEARSTLAQAKVVLGHMKKDVRFEETTNYNRKQWGELLAALSSR